MASALSNLIDNLADWIYEIKYKYEHGNKKFEYAKIKYAYVQDDLLLYKCFCCHRNHQKRFEAIW